MSSVKIVVDSTLNIPAHFTDELDIQVAPTTVIWADKEYRDGIDIHPTDYCERIATIGDDFPTTTAVNPFQFQQIFDSLLQVGHDVLTLLPSTKITRTFQSAWTAQASVDSDRIVVIDSQTSGMAAGWVAVLAARAARQGASLADCETMVRQALANTGYFGTLDTLDGLLRSGRVGKAGHLLGGALKIKPILEVNDGEMGGVERVRTRKRSLNRVVTILEERIAGRGPVYLAVMHACAPDEAQRLLDEATARVDVKESVIVSFCPTVAVAYGPGAVGYNYLIGDSLDA